MSVSAVTAVTTMTSVATMSAMAPTATMSVSAAIVFTTAGAAGLDHPAVNRATVAVMADAGVNPKNAATGMIVSDPGPSAAAEGAGAGGGRSEDGHAHKGGKEQAEQFHDGEQLEVGWK